MGTVEVVFLERKTDVLLAFEVLLFLEVAVLTLEGKTVLALIEEVFDCFGK